MTNIQETKPSGIVTQPAIKKPLTRHSGDTPATAYEDTISLSSASISRDEEEKRLARVAAIRDQLAAGSYNISGKDVANKILNALKG